jgi:glycerol-3-phosphate dehydrogenase
MRRKGGGGGGGQYREMTEHVFDAKYTSLQEELKLSEKKLLLLSARKAEEQEARSALQRKQARLKALKETQARDPANFRNQARF